MTLEELYEEKRKINEQIDKLESEKRLTKKNKDIEEHKQYVGKYYAAIDSNNQYRDISAFKVLCLDKYEPARSVECFCIKEEGVERRTIWLWSSSTERLMPLPSDQKIIDLYKEISKEEFNMMFDDHLDKLLRGE